MKNMTVSYQFPAYIAEIINVIGNGDWLVSNFNIDSHSKALNPAAYCYNTEFNDTLYTACVDLNIFQFMVNSVKKTAPKELYRTAIAYLAFFQVAGIEVDPTYAVYEKVNHQTVRAREGVEDLFLFRQLNNMPANLLAMYAVGETNQLILEKKSDSTDISHIATELTRHRRLKDWSSLYAIILAVVRIEFDDSIPRQKKLGAFINWSFCVFRHSLPGFVFAISVLGHKKLGRAMKFDPSKPVEERRATLVNMTWEIYYMQQYFQRWVSRTTGTETLFLTNDKAFAQILRLSIDVQKSQSLQPLKHYTSGFDQQHFSYIMHPESYPYDRAYDSDHWGIEYRDKIINELEEKLLDPKMQ